MQWSWYDENVYSDDDENVFGGFQLKCSAELWLLLGNCEKRKVPFVCSGGESSSNLKIHLRKVCPLQQFCCFYLSKTLFWESNCCSCFISKLPKFRLLGPERIILAKQEGKDGAHDVMCTIMTAMTDAQIEFLTFGSPATDPLTRAQLSTMKMMSSSILSGQHNLIIIVIVMLRSQLWK